MKSILAILIGFAFCLNNSTYAKQEFDIKSNQDINVIHEKKFHDLWNPVLPLADSLLKSYIIEDTAVKLWTSLTRNFHNGIYNDFNDGQTLADQINQDLLNISNDLHLKLVYSETTLQPNLDREAITVEEEFMVVEWLKTNNYGVQEHKVLKGNIGYIDLSLFAPLKYGKHKLVDAMKTVEDTDALIIDLRKNMGSLDPDTVPFLMSYFFESATHIFNFENREKKRVQPIWTTEQVPGKKYLNKPVYILTSPQTFSGGEEFAYDMKYHNKAILVGETTKGGANPTTPVRINDHFMIVMPKERSVNTITKTNWEQSGVNPDIVVDANFAFYESQLILLDELYCKKRNRNKKEIENALKEVEALKPKYQKLTFKLDGYPFANSVFLAGSFNYWNRIKHPLKRTNEGWIIEVDILPGEIQYKFCIDGEWILDPNNPKTIENNERFNSVIQISE